LLISINEDTQRTIREISLIIENEIVASLLSDPLLIIQKNTKIVVKRWIPKKQIDKITRPYE
jgi:hypothetical protein